MLPERLMHHTISNMARSTVSMRELQRHLKRVMARVERGETIEVTRSHRTVARLTPVKPATVVSPWPDLEARTRAAFGKRVIKHGAADIVREDRGER